MDEKKRKARPQPRLYDRLPYSLSSTPLPEC